MATPSGEQAIGSLKVGDTVLAYNPVTGKSEPEPVQHVWRNQDHDLVDVRLTLAGSPAAGTTQSSANDANGRNSASAGSADSTSGATRTTATPTRLHRWVAGGVLAAGLGATLLTTASAPAQAAAATTTTTAPPATQTEVIHTTANHPWLTTDRGWVHAGDLQPGERVVTLPAASGQTGSASSAAAATTDRGWVAGESTSGAQVAEPNGRHATVVSVHTVSGAADMYNLTVAEDHTYAVGFDHIVVHNANNPCSTLPILSRSQIEDGLAEAEQYAVDNTAYTGAIAKISGENEFWSRGFNREINPSDANGVPGRFAPDDKLAPWQDAGRGNCAEFYCLDVRHRPNAPIDLFIYHPRGEGPCPACRVTFSKFVENNNGYPIRAFWYDADGVIRSQCWLC